MKAPLSWMQEFAPLKGDPADLAATMTDLGMVVESIDSTGPQWGGIIVAKILALRPHPEADKIQLVDVDVGDGEALQICCGAFNMSVGDLVPLATLGTVMPGGLEIARRKLRGQWSNGMLCSSVELGLGDDEDGIMILAPNLSIGQDLISALGASQDVVFDLDIEGNRPDALSIAGITRDLAARLGVSFTNREPAFTEVEPPATSLCSVEISAPELCSRFGVRVLENVTVGESPAWLADRLTAAGMRPINSIVDISNYVMLELGQPNHTYDLGLVPDGKLGVRMARDGETLTTLDDVERTVTASDGLIVNGNDEPIGLAGVMGGASTEISGSTTAVLVEAAVWDRMTVAKTSRRLGLRSEASTRFERGADPYGIERALNRFVELAEQLCGAKVATGMVIAEGDLPVPKPIKVRVERVNSLLNTSLTAAEMASLLNPIGFETSVVDQDLSVVIPTWRPDATAEIDVVEEIGRHNGYDKSGKRVPTPVQAGGLTVDQANRRRLRQILIGSGFSEAMPIPFLAPNDLARAGLSEDGITLANPLVAEESVLRTSLLPGMLKAVSRNQAYRNGPVQLYEVGQVYQTSDEQLPVETERVAVVGSGFGTGANTVAAATQAVQWLHQLAANANMAGLSVVNGVVPGLHPTRSATVRFRGKTIGSVGEVDPAVLERYGIDGRLAWFELEVGPILAALDTIASYKPVSVYPSSDFDLAFTTPNNVAATDLTRTLKKAGDGMIESVELFDVYRGDQLGGEVRSLAFRIRVQAVDHTLTDDEVAAIRSRAIDQVTSKHNAVLR